MLTIVRHSRFGRLLVWPWLCALWMLGGFWEARAQYTDPLSGMQFESMALANTSLMLSLAQRSVFYQSVPLRLSRGKGQGGSRMAAPPPAVSAERRGATAPSGARSYGLTDFRPQRRQSIAAQFAGLSDDPQQRQQLLALGEAIFKEIERSPEFRRNNLTYGIALALSAAVGIQRGQDLTDEESDFLLGAVHELLTSDPQVMRQPAAELTKLYDTCLLLAGLMTTFHLDAKHNGTRDSEAAAKRLAEVTLKALGWNANQ